MFRRSQKLDRKRPTRADYEREAALILEERIAEGRPPPNVWRKAAESRAKEGQAAVWYVPETAGADSGGEAPRVLVPIGEPFVLRAVRLPAPAATMTPSEGDRSRPRVVNASTEYRL